MDNIIEKIEWSSNVPIFKSSIIIKQLVIAIGIPFSIVIVLIAANSGLSQNTMYAVGMIVVTLFLTFLFIKAVYGGNYHAKFIVDNEGVKCSTQDKYRKRNRIINALTVLVGLLVIKPAVAGAGLIAESKSVVFIPWKNVKSVKYNDAKQIILINGKLTQSIALFCNKENYPMVKKAVRGRTHG